MKKYWFVYRSDGGLPVRKHQHFADAAADAKRLAEANQGQVFDVLESMTSTTKNDVTAIKHEVDVEEPPF